MKELRWLDSLQGSGIRPGLRRMRAFLRAAGHPEREVPSILIAGTNGKGSTAATLAAILEQAGCRYGLYTSPHLIDLQERWIIGGRKVSPEELRRATRQLWSLARSVGFKPTYFEALTIVAFLLFRDLKCELALLEVGMGGRLDATNVVQPLLALVTSVSMDHMEFLGKTLRAIARQKAGVIHRGSIALTSSRNAEVLEVIRARCAQQSVTLHVMAEETRALDVEMDALHLRFRLATPSDRYRLESPLVGWHQLENIALAVRAAEELRKHFPEISHDAIVEGVATAKWRGRLERFEIEGKSVWVDGGHNADAARRIAEYVKARIPAPRLLVFGIMRDKQVEEVAAQLFPHFEQLILTRPPSKRAATTAQLARSARRLGVRFQSASRPVDALKRALDSSAASVLVFGSLYLAGEAVPYLDKRIAANAAAARRRADRSQLAATK